MKSTVHRAVALACAAFIAGCGGGGDTQPSALQQAGVPDKAQKASIANPTEGDTILVVSLVPGSSSQIQVTDRNGAPVPLSKNNGAPVTLIDELPEGLGNLPWAKTAPATPGHLRVQLTPGTYRFTTGWVWPVAASGHDVNRQIVVEPKPGAQGEVALLGSVEKTAAYAPGQDKVSLPTGSLQRFEQLWAEGTRAIRARHPNPGSFYYVRAAAQGWPASATDPTVVSTLGGVDVNRQAFQADPDAFAQLAAIKDANDTEAVVVLMNEWQVNKHRVAELDRDGQRVRISPRSPWALAKGTAQRYFIENRASLLDAAGEWYWSKGNATLTYKPLAPNTGSTPTTVRFEVPQVVRLLSMKGAVDSGKWLQYVQFSGLKFRYAKVDMHPDGYVDGQADTGVSAAIELNDTRQVVFANCEVSHTGGYGVWLNSRVRDVSVESSELYDLGAGGVKIGKQRPGGPDSVDVADTTDPNHTGDNQVIYSRIHSTGHVYPGAIGVWIGRSSGNHIDSNLIKDTTYSGISVGWNWNTGQSMAHDNYILRNFLHNIGQYALGDLGGVYLLGRAPSTYVAFNVIKEVHGYHLFGAPARGIYADEGSSQLTVMNNLVYGVDGEGFFLHYGEDNKVSYNDFAKVGQGFGIGRRAGPTAVPVTLKGNGFFPTGNNMISLFGMGVPSLITSLDLATAQWVAPAPVLNGNKVSPQFLPSGTALAIPGLCTGCATDASRVITDAGGLSTPTVSDGTWYANSEWSQSDIQPAVSAARLWDGHLAPVPPKVIDFRAAQWPLKAVASVPDLPVYMTIAQTAPALSLLKDAAGVQYLALNDEARPQNVWEPYLQSTPKYAKGSSATVRFRAKFDPQSYLVHEWRTDANGQQVGPKISFVGNGTDKIDVRVNGVSLGAAQQLDAGAWNTFELKAVLGASTWTLSRNGTLIGTFPAAHPSIWGALNNLVFYSNANVATTAAFADIYVENR